MLRSSSFAYVADNIGVETVKIFQCLGHRTLTRSASIGDVVYVSVRTLNKLLFSRLKERQKKKFKRGTIHRAVVVHTRKKIFRDDYTWMWFGYNAVVLVDKQGKPYGRKILGVIPREVALKYPTIASICSLVV